MDQVLHSFQDTSSFLAFAFAGKATFTVTSKASGSHYTFDINGSKRDHATFFASVHAAEGPLYLGMVRRDQVARGIIPTKASRAGEEAPSVQALTWLLRQLSLSVEMPSAALVQHEGRCGVCRRRLTHPASLLSGVGPECSGRLSCN